MGAEIRNFAAVKPGISPSLPMEKVEKWRSDVPAPAAYLIIYCVGMK